MHATIEIDCPNQDETVSPGHYTFRISSSEALVEAEISVDRGPWNSCRHACGLWWYDWEAGRHGEHQVAARGTTRRGDAVNSHFRRFLVGPRR
ncbi:MAG: hypothetical protein HY079_01045 [Elusimicrobia bacterium]|nr:hypothetical protein [Elusimicrobiota bacterium]